MEKEKKPFYRYCMVPMCPNTIKSTPDKVFFAVPRDPNIRKQWCKVMRRDNVSPISRQHCCEDHFNIKEDTVNYIKYKLMKEQGEKVKLLLNKGVMPHKFQCQKRNVSSPQERMYAVKKRRLSLMNKALSEPEDNINRELKFVDDEVVFETNIMKCETEMVSESGKYDLFGGEIVTHNLEEKCYIDKIKSESVLDVYYEPISEKCIEKISEGPQNKFLEIQVKKELESVEDEVVFETDIKCETEMVSESGKYDMFGIEMVTHNLKEKYDIDQIKSEGVIDVYNEPISENCIGKISEGSQNKFLEIQVKRELESVKDEVVFETDMKCETEMVSESGKCDMFGIEMVTHNLEEKYDIDQIRSEGVIDVYLEPKSEKCIEEISEGPQNKFFEIQGKILGTFSLK
ncbi:uncharacterized protein isoform X2 [Leptinotarsa decemlineata]|uniref:uncharacterized protein isoform X2 n=1 Tax=Leptinotarsa decemlineata TaxID=7539 RepID=UPI000C255862|nr:uncharacterized protein LOC111512685 isoform X2 [Leptinotarsa decemlineata]